jgi:imidazolonepropionase-like amidohydrolase
MLLIQPGPLQARNAPLLIRDVTLFDGHILKGHRSVLVRDGLIARVGNARLSARDARVVDGKGKTLLPGFIDAHVHLPHVDIEDALRQSARLGVTTVIDMFTDQPTVKTLKRLEAADLPGLADLRTAGVGATAPGGHPTELGGVIPTISCSCDADTFVQQRIAEGSDFIKIILEDARQFGPKAKPMPTLDERTLQALIRAAHRHRKLVAVHVQTEAYARMAIAAGADGLAHLFLGPSISSDFASFAAKHRIFVIPTLAAEYFACGRSDSLAIAADKRLMAQTYPQFTALLKQAPHASPISCEATDQALLELDKAGVPLLIGTDAPVPGSTYGASTLDEMSLFVRDGIAPVKALAAGTSIPAKVFRLRDRGEIKAGKRADLLLVRGNPAIRIDDLRNIVAVWKKGRAVRRAAALK